MDKHPMHGFGKSLPQKYIERLIDELVRGGFLKEIHLIDDKINIICITVGPNSEELVLKNQKVNLNTIIFFFFFFFSNNKKQLLKTLILF